MILELEHLRSTFYYKQGFQTVLRYAPPAPMNNDDKMCEWTSVNGAAVRQLKVQQETKMSGIGILPKACYHDLRPSVTKMVRLCLNKKIWNPTHIILRTECNREFKGSVWNL